MRRALLLGFFFLLSCASLALAEPKFPPLTGRVVDEAHVLSPGVEAKLNAKLAGLEAVNGTQLVVAILKSLQGYEIQDYGYQLGRAWGVGQKGKNNGVIMIVVPSEKKVGIEVGYGHEGDLTDAASSHIINDIMMPEFSQNHIAPGIWKGADALVTLLAGGAQVQAVASDSGDELSNTTVFIILIIVIILCIRYPTLAWFIFANLPSGSFRSGGGGGGGFSGGGGSFGGGGSSGSW
jgi:uncharacterized protein